MENTLSWSRFRWLVNKSSHNDEKLNFYHDKNTKNVRNILTACIAIIKTIFPVRNMAQTSQNIKEFEQKAWKGLFLVAILNLENWVFCFEAMLTCREPNNTSLYIDGKLRISTFHFFLFERLATKPIKVIALERHVYQKAYIYVIRNVSKTYMYVIRSGKVKYFIEFTVILQISLIT